MNSCFCLSCYSSCLLLSNSSPFSPNVKEGWECLPCCSSKCKIRNEINSRQQPFYIRISRQKSRAIFYHKIFFSSKHLAWAGAGSGLGGVQRVPSHTCGRPVSHLCAACPPSMEYSCFVGATFSEVAGRQLWPGRHLGVVLTPPARWAGSTQAAHRRILGASSHIFPKCK